ncbi:hypothetical protein EMCRGX_G002184 [Ephydatia muelleri]
MQSPIQPQQLKPAPPLVQTLLKDIMVKCERCKRDVKAGDYDTHQCSTLPTKVEVKMASRVLKRLASTSPEQTLLCTGGKITQPRTSTFTASARTIKGRCIEMQTVREVVSQGESSALLRRELHYLSDTDRQALLNEAGVENAP